jgi:hypothetical protein
LQTKGSVSRASLAVTVLDDAGDSFELIVDADEALEVFHHTTTCFRYRELR